MMNEKEDRVPKENQLSGSPSDGGISFRQWDKNAQDDMRAMGGEIMVEHYMGKEMIMPMWCAPASKFNWVDNQCIETLSWESDPEKDENGEVIVYDAMNQRWMNTDKQKIWMEYVAEVSTKSCTKVNAAPPKWSASHCSLAWQSQLAHNRDGPVKNTRKLLQKIPKKSCAHLGGLS